MAFIIWVVLCVGSGWLIFGPLWPTKSWDMSDEHLSIGYRLSLILLFITTVASPLYYEYPNYGLSKVVTFDGDKVIEHPFGTFVSEFSNDYSNVPIGTSLIRSGATFTTENPKVRHLQYLVAAEIVDMEAFFKERHRRHNPGDNKENNASYVDTKDLVAGACTTVKEEIVDLVAYQLVEFNNHFSKQLAQFYNPLDHAQQREFQALLTAYLNAGLAKDGIMVKAQSFIIE